MAIQRATFAEINLGAFRQNLQRVRSALAPGVKTLAVVKADAYGHGAVPCAREAVVAGADWLGVGIIEEGIELRQQGITTPILVLGSIFTNEVDDLIQHNLSTTVTTPHLVQALSKRAVHAEKPVGLHIKIDTGMSRLGVLPEDFLPLVEKVSQDKNLCLEGVSTHFSCADDEDPEYTLLQLSRFKEALTQLQKADPGLPLVHCANSAAMIKYPATWFDLVRPGLILYGALPSPGMENHLQQFIQDSGEILPVMQWKSKIIQINCISKGSPISYGNTFITSQNSRIATLPLGYADGLSRHLSNKMRVLVNGEIAPQVGTICMDLCLVDVSKIPEAKVGDEVVLFGRQGNQTITVDEVAQWSGTIPYEILCGVSKRVPRVYIS